MGAVIIYSGYLLRFEPRRTDKIEESLRLRGEASESFSTLDSEFERREVVLLSLTPGKPTIGVAAVMERMYGSGGTGKLKMRITEPVFFEPPIESDEVVKIIPLESWTSSAERLRRVEVAIWGALIGTIKSLRPGESSALENLFVRRVQERRLLGSEDKTQRLIEERDAVGLSLDVAGLDRSPVLSNLDIDRLDSSKSVLDLLDCEPLQEQDIIRHDEQIFRGLLEPESRVGQFEDGSATVRIHVYDKKALESVLGIDLLIYQSVYKSFLLIQYKAMQHTREGARASWWSRIDSQIHSQMAAMKRLEIAVGAKSTPPPAITDWRLNSTPFYFKFCERTRPDARDDSLIRGITISLEHLRDFLALPESRGDRDGQRIGYDNCARYLNNTEFTALARAGWIGCSNEGFALISEILEANRKGGRLAMLAVIEKTAPLTASERGRRRG